MYLSEIFIPYNTPFMVDSNNTLNRRLSSADCRNRSTTCCLFASREIQYIRILQEKTALSDDDLTEEGGLPTYIRLPIHAQCFRFSRTVQYTFHRRSLIMIPDDAGLPHSNTDQLLHFLERQRETFCEPWIAKYTGNC